MVTKASSDFADETRRFRNIEVRGYDCFLPQYAGHAVIAAESLSLSVLTELMTFQGIIDGPV